MKINDSRKVPAPTVLKAGVVYRAPSGDLYLAVRQAGINTESNNADGVVRLLDGVRYDLGGHHGGMADLYRAVETAELCA